MRPKLQMGILFSLEVILRNIVYHQKALNEMKIMAYLNLIPITLRKEEIL